MSRYPLSDLTKSDLESPNGFLFESLLAEPMQEQEYEDYLQKIYQVLLKFASGIQDDDNTRQIATRFRINETNDLFRKVGKRWLKIQKLNDRRKVMAEIHDSHGHFG